MTQKISIVVPVYNEEEVLSELYRRISQVMDQLNDPWELILVDDGSVDRSAELMRELYEQDPRIMKDLPTTGMILLLCI